MLATQSLFLAAFVGVAVLLLVTGLLSFAVYAGFASGWIQRHRRLVAVTGGGLLAVVIAILGGVGWIGSERAIHPSAKIEDHTLAEYDFAAGTETVTFPSLDGTPLVGWFVPSGQPVAPTVILLHGHDRSRAELLPHAAYLHRAGYNVLLFDFRGRGESGGGAVTLGAKEPRDVRGAVSYVLSRPDVDPARVAVQGVSQGASSGILAMADDPRIAAIVAESAFTDLRGVVDRGFEDFIDLPSFPFAPITVFIVERRVGASADDVRPIDAITRIGNRPVFIIDDLNDTKMPLNSGPRLYEAAPGAKEMWQVAGAGHAGAYKVQPDEYERRVLAFYHAYLDVAPAARAP